jgi:uncharacterized Zn finger protein
MRENGAAKADRLLVSGRVFVRRVNRNEVAAAVRGDSGEMYEVGFIRGRWRCSCPAIGPCSHLIAVQRVSLAPGSLLIIEQAPPEPSRTTTTTTTPGSMGAI